ncbi:MAG: AAA domain-containing protein [Gemmataceae bacterium]
MTAVHLDPLPPRCSPGAVLAFVCNTTGLDRKHVGKIALIGRGATVELDDRHASKAVAALDGAAFNDRPVRARFAGKADFSNADHFATLSKLLDLEAAAEEAEARRRAAEGTGRGDGGTLPGLVLRESEFGLSGRLLLTFGRASRTEPLPPNRLGPGSPVVLTRTKPQRGVTFRGVVYDRGDTTIGVAIEPPDYDFDDDEGWRLDLSPDEVSRLRQQDALRRAAGADGDRLAALRAVLLGEREPDFDADQPPHEFLTPLNPPQRDAVRFALAAKDVAVIHGPPGTGKTTTVAELIRCLVARGDKVLACAASNHAVDNLLEKLLRVGLQPVRLGHPARVVPELRARALDLLAEKHPDARQARKVAREAFALFRSADKWSRAKPEPGAKAAMRREARELLAEVRRLEAQAVERVLDDSRVVCATLTGLDGQTLGRRTFDTAVLDEACQSTEPASWLPLLRAGRVILAGDHCQLPPTVLSPEAADAGLSVSLMERVVAQFGGQVARRLVVQYRMHESIQAFSSAEFYDGELVAHESVVAHSLADMPGVAAGPTTETPVRFIDTAGAGYDEEQEEETESRLNRQEAALAARQVRLLLAAGVTADEVAVITPYRGQVRLLRELLKDHPTLEVDSVDGFQGREKEAVVISLVRSNPAGEIGFLADTRRTNVALTRARRALVVIGDSATLAADPFYARMIAHFEATGAYSSVWELDSTT